MLLKDILKLLIIFLRPIIVFFLKLRLFFKPQKKAFTSRVCIYTSCFGGYDLLKSQCKQSIDADFICFTDTYVYSDTWQVIKCTPMYRDSRKSAKWYKINSHLIPELASYHRTIYIDASAHIETKYFAEIVLGFTNEIGFFRHPYRTSIWEEYNACKSMSKYRDANLLMQVTNYLNQIKKDELLLAGGVICRCSPHLANFNSSWWREMSQSLQDQISLPFVILKLSQSFSILPTNLMSGILITFKVQHRMHEYEKA